MCADFTLAQVGGAPQSAVSPQRPVEQPSGASAALSFASSAATSLFESFAESEKEQQQEEVNQAVSRFSQQQLQIADAVDRGDMSSQQARMSMRRNYASAIANNPGLTTEFAKTHSSLVSTSGLGKVAAEGTEQEQQFMKVQQDATSKGWVTSGMSAEEAEEATMAYQQFNREQESIDAQQNQLSLQRAQIGLQSDRVGLGTAQINQQRASLGLQEDKARRRSQEAVGSMSDAAGTRLRTKFNSIERQVESGQLDRVEATQMMDEEWLMIQSEVTRVGGRAGSEYLSNMVAPLRSFYESKRGYITGETDRETMESITGNAIARQSLNIAGDPEAARLLATSQLVGAGGATVLQGPLTNLALDKTSRNSDETRRPADLTDSAEEGGTQQYLDLLSEGMRKAGEGGNEELNRDVTTNVNQVLRGLGSYGNMVENPKELNPALDYFASDTYGRWVEQNGTGVNQEHLSAAREAIQVQYDEVVRPLIAEEWRNASQLTYAVPDPTRPDTAGQTESVTSSIRPFFTGSGVRFVPNEGAEMNPRLRSKLRELNGTVSPVVNRLVRLGAHWEGHRDYQRIYESNYAGLFGDAGTGTESEE